MDNHKSNGSPHTKDLDSDQEECTGKIKVLVHQDALDVDDRNAKKDLSSGERHHLDIKISKKRPSVAEPVDLITPLSDESSPTIPSKPWDDKHSLDPDYSDESNCFSTLFPCCGDLVNIESMTVGRFLGLVISFAFYLGNLASDAIVCYHLFFHGNWLWFGLVAAFTIIPTVALNVISYHLSIAKMKVKRSLWNQSESVAVSIIVALLHLSQFGVLARYLGYVFLHELEYLWVIFCPNEKRKDFDHRSGKYVELPYLPYLFMTEAMLQCLPQLLVQLYILIVGNGVLAEDVNQMLIASIIVSLLNLSRLLTTCKHMQKNFTTPWSGLFFMYLWFLFTSISRILSFTLFMTQFLLGFLMLCLFHWIIMSIWAVSVLTPSVSCRTLAGVCKNMSKYLKGLVCGVMYLICFIDLRIADDSSEQSTVPSRYLYVFFYAVMFLENSVIIVLWFVYCSELWYSVLAIVVTFVSFFCGVLAMFVYYRCFHRNVVGDSERWKCVLLYPARNRIM